MGKRGPKRKSLKLLKSSDSWRGKDREGEPDPPEGLPEPPPELDKRGLEIWERVVPMISTMGILGACDSQAVARYCVAVVFYWDTQRVLAAHGMTVLVERYDKEGNCIGVKEEEAPEVRRLKMLSDECRMLENLMGLSPGARASLSVDKPKDPKENRGKKRAFPGKAS